MQLLNQDLRHPQRYHYAEWKHAKVHIDYHFVFDDHYYSVPYQYIHHAVELRATAKTIECFYQGKRIAAHSRSKARYQHTTLSEHMPKNHQAHAEWTPERIKRWALKIGSNTSGFIETMISARAFPEQAFRSCLGLLRLGSRFGEMRLEKACTIALGAGMTRYQQVERLLKNKMDELEMPQEHTTPVIPNHHNIRGSDYYQ
jgi:hypothetical protein